MSRILRSGLVALALLLSLVALPAVEAQAATFVLDDQVSCAALFDGEIFNGECRTYNLSPDIIADGDVLQAAIPFSSRSITNNGTINILGGAYVLSRIASTNNGTITVASGATLRTVNGTITNNGTITVACGGSVTASISGNQPQYATDCTGPAVTVNQAAGQADPATTGPVTFTAVFDESVTGFDAADVVLGGTAGATGAVVTGNGTTYTIAVSGMTTSGTVSASVKAGAVRDAAGNPSSASTSIDNTVIYAPQYLTLRGFYQPVDMTPAGGTRVFNTVKGGATVPLKFEVFAGATERTDTTVVKGLDAKQITCDNAALVDDIEETATGGTALRYDATGGLFVYNWKTPTGAGKCYSVTLTLVDGTATTAYFRTK